MLNAKKKCICKKCEDCRLFIAWDMTNTDGLRKQQNKCILEVLASEIPKIMGSIDGCQQAANESRNRSNEAKAAVQDFITRTKNTLKVISSMKMIGDK